MGYVIEQESVNEAEFLEKRKAGIGGSDIAHLFSLEPYFCETRVALDKLGFVGEDISNEHMERGKRLEPIVISKLEDVLKKTITKAGAGYNDNFPFIRVNADALIFGEDFKLEAVVEIKCPAKFSYFNMLKNGIPEYYNLQAHAEMLAYGVDKCYFVLYCEEIDSLHVFEIYKCEDYKERIFEKCLDFWGKITSKADLKQFHAVDDKRCKDCPQYLNCTNRSQIDPKEAIERYNELSIAIGKLEDEKDALKGKIMELVKRGIKVSSGLFYAEIRTTKRNSLDTKSIPEDIKMLYTKETQVESLIIKEMKDE